MSNKQADSKFELRLSRNYHFPNTNTTCEGSKSVEFHEPCIPEFRDAWGWEDCTSGYDIDGDLDHNLYPKEPLTVPRDWATDYLRDDPRPVLDGPCGAK